MASLEVTAKEREQFARARKVGETHSQDPSALIGASYNRHADAVELVFRGGGRMTIPRTLIPEIRRASTSHLKSVSISPAGDAISWRSLDVDIYIPGLVERAFGARLFAAAAGQRGGRRRTKTKAAAAKVNGAKGGRPRKRLLV